MIHGTAGPASAALDAATLRRLVDRQQIEDLFARQAHGLDRHDQPLAENAFPVGGAAAQLARWRDATRSHSHGITTQCLAITDEGAEADTYVLAAFHLAAGQRVWVESWRHRDRLVRAAAGWRIAERQSMMDLAFSATAQRLDEAAGGYAAGSRDRDDPSYQRPLALSDQLRRALDGQGPARPRPADARPAYAPPPADAADRLCFLADRRAIRDAIVQAARDRDLDELSPFQRRHLTTHNAEVFNDTASAESYVMMVSRDASGARMIGQRLLDRLRRDGKEWRIAERRTVTEWQYPIVPEEPGR